MKLVEFAGQNGRPVYVNPALVTSVTELNEKLSQIDFGSDQVVLIPLPVALVVDDLRKERE